jgi:hypothetical protein
MRGKGTTSFLADAYPCPEKELFLGVLRDQQTLL